MATYTMTFKQLKEAVAINSFICIDSLNKWYDCFAQSLEAHRPDTYKDWSRCGKVTRELHSEYLELKGELQFFLDSLEHSKYFASELKMGYESALITLTPKQIALLQAL